MNAHSPKPETFAREVASPQAAPCPAERLGREVEHINREIARLGDVLATDDGAAWNSLVARQLEDRAEVLRSQLQWAKATTLAGIYAQTCELRRFTQSDALAAGLTSSDTRAVERLSALVDRAIRDLGGFKQFELGGLTGVQSADDFAEALALFTGQDVQDW